MIGNRYILYRGLLSCVLLCSCIPSKLLPVVMHAIVCNYCTNKLAHTHAPIAPMYSSYRVDLLSDPRGQDYKEKEKLYSKQISNSMC